MQKPPKWSPESSKIEPKWCQEEAMRAPKSKNNIDPTKKRVAFHRVLPPVVAGWWQGWQGGRGCHPPATPLPPWGQDGEKINEKQQRNKEEGSISHCPPPLCEKVAYMAPTWVPSCSQDGSKINAKMHHFFDASWNRFLGGFWWILGTKIEPSWHQNGIKNRC